MKQSSYGALRRLLQTGDVVLFSGKGRESAVIRWLTRGRCTHVGLVIVHDALDQVLLWESTTLSDLIDLDTGVPARGVQVVPLSDRLASYDGEVSVRLLDLARTPEHLDAVGTLRRRWRGRPYETRQLELLRSAWDGFAGESRGDLSSIFCSELVAAVWQEWGILPPHPVAGEYVPEQWQEDSRAPVSLLSGSLSEELVIRRGDG